MKAAGSPVPALKSKSSSVSLSGNRHPILQESLPTSITDKWLKDTRFPQTSGFCDAPFSNLLTRENRKHRSRIHFPGQSNSGQYRSNHGVGCIQKPNGWRL